MNNADNIQTASLQVEASLELKALHLLRKLTDKPNAQWTSSLQWQAIFQIYQRQKDVIVIAATGSGKTMIALLPTLIGGRNELALLFLPLNSLISDYKRKFNKMQIPYDIFTPGQTFIKPQSKFLIVSPDHAQSAKWKQLLVSLTDLYNISRLIFDESHIPITSVDYRKVMHFLNQLRIIPMQMVLITATCPPSSLDFMMTLFGLEKGSTVVFRGPTDRPELEYVRMPAMGNLDKCLPFLDQLIQTHALEENDRTMIFVPYISTGEKVADHLKCSFYHSKNSDNTNYAAQLDYKEKMYNAWFTGHATDGRSNKTIVATSALSAGNDYSSVRLVVHLNTPIEMMTYVQEVSRGGRDGKPAKCVLVPIKVKSSIPEVPEPDHKGKLAMHEYITGQVDCLHFAITSFCDGAGVYCYNDDKRQKCSFCRLQRNTTNKKKDQLLPVSANIEERGLVWSTITELHEADARYRDALQ